VTAHGVTEHDVTAHGVTGTAVTAQGVTAQGVTAQGGHVGKVAQTWSRRRGGWHAQGWPRRGRGANQAAARNQPAAPRQWPGAGTRPNDRRGGSTAAYRTNAYNSWHTS
jgi:hypothetical protein